MTEWMRNEPEHTQSNQANCLSNQMRARINTTADSLNQLTIVPFHNLMRNSKLTKACNFSQHIAIKMNQRNRFCSQSHFAPDLTVQMYIFAQALLLKSTALFCLSFVICLSVCRYVSVLSICLSLIWTLTYLLALCIHYICKYVQCTQCVWLFVCMRVSICLFCWFISQFIVSFLSLLFYCKYCVCPTIE